MIIGLRRFQLFKGFKTLKSFKLFKPLPLILPRDAGEDACAGFEPGDGLNDLHGFDVSRCSWSM